MKGRPENEFPTIGDLHEVLADMVKRGLGALPVQVLVVPDSTLQALARQMVPDGPKLAAAMMEFSPDEGSHRIPVSFVSAERLAKMKPMTHSTVQ